MKKTTNIIKRLNKVVHGRSWMQLPVNANYKFFKPKYRKFVQQQIIPLADRKELLSFFDSTKPSHQ